MLAADIHQCEVTVNKAEVLAILRENLKVHLTDHAEAMEGYYNKRIQDLEKALAQAKAGEHTITCLLSWPIPQSHEKDYNRAIRMLELSTENVIRLDGAAFENYVMDEWQWKAAVIATTQLYKTFNNQ